MRYNIMGFYQPRAVELGLDSNDLLVLRWFVDYAGTKKMRSMIIDNKIYYWVNYATVLQELPILRISKQTLYKKHFINLCNANVLIHKQMKEGGNFSYYCYGINYETLLYLQTDDPSVRNDDLASKSTQGMSENTEPCVETYTTLASENTQQILDNNTNQPIKEYISNNKNKENIKEIIDYLNQRLGTSYKYSTLKTIKFINARLNEGFSVDDFKIVIDKKYTDWKGTEYEIYLTPDTLFSGKFEKYLNQTSAKSNFKKSAKEQAEDKFREIIARRNAQ